jgi:hypothetical protein
MFQQGSTDHISPTADGMTIYFQYKTPQYITVANGSKECIFGEGTVEVQLESGYVFELHNVKHVPSATKRLLSVGKAYDDGLNVIINGMNCHITDSEGTVLGHADTVFPFLWLKDLNVPDYSGFASQHSGEEVELNLTQSDAVKVDVWHKRLCHLPPRSMGQLPKMVTGLSLPSCDLSKCIGVDGTCDGCMLGKMSSKPYKSTHSTVKQKLELVHVDLMGPITPMSLDEEKYALTFIDEFTDYSAVVLLKQKSDASKEVIALLTQLETQTGCVSKNIRSDYGTEFNGLDAFCRKRGIVHQRTTPYAHAQNGKVERLNRTLQERARAILAETQQPLELWGEALLTSNYVRNLCPTSNSECTPFQRMFDKVPDVSHLRVFGSECFVLTPKHLRGGKFAPVSEKGVFLGYQGKSYRVLLDDRVKLVRPEDVKCLETSIVPGSKSPSEHPDPLEIPVPFQQLFLNKEDAVSEVSDVPGDVADSSELDS